MTLVEDLPEESDFGQLERILPAHGSVELADRAREELLGKWALVDMEGAANHVMENHGRIPPEAMRVVVSVALDSGDDSALQWIQKLPEGAFLNQAAAAVVERSLTAAPDTAHEFVEMIQDEEMRARILKQIRESSGSHLKGHDH
ncbi:MAG: hypothetical protein EOP88_17050 [Verrucomicrobiaceae bacterium]|nr:MAG: hypothetical protein EOP88_17050 [Verrucomicrobiaceae bacterium]